MRTFASCRVTSLAVALAIACSCAAPESAGHSSSAVTGGSAAAADAAADAAAEKPLRIEQVLSRSSLVGVSPSSPAWSPNSQHLAFRWQDVGGKRRELWLVAADGAKRRQLTSHEQPGGSVGEFVWMPDGASLLYRRGRSLWQTGLDGASREVAKLGGGASRLAVSPDGRYASFLKGGDLWLVDLAAGGGKVRQLTSVGVDSISKVPMGRYRRREVEIGTYVWGGPSYAWAPDSRTLAVHYVDRRGVRTVPFPSYIGEEIDPNLVRRSYPGDANEKRMVALLAVDGGELEPLDLPDPEAVRIADFSWSRDGRLLIDRESDTAVDRWLHVYDPSAAPDDRLRELWHDHRETRVYTTVGSAWHPSGEHVLVLADLDDRYGLYALPAAGGGTPTRLSDPASDVTGGPVVAADSGDVFYPCNARSPYERQVFRVALGQGAAVDVGSDFEELAGELRPYPSPDGSSVALLHSGDAQPTELYITSGRGSDAKLRRITRSTPPAFDERPWADVRYATFAAADGATLHARILEPRGLDRSARHPVLFGPVYSNTVRNRWGGFYGMFQQLLVERGYIVVQVDVRGSTGYGRAFREQFLGDFAGRDLEDLASAVAYMESLSFVDPDRIGVWGSSYGGTLTAYALLKKPGLFDAGVACAAAVDPRFFGSDDVAIVRRPDTHPDVFLRGAAQYAANLQDPLLLIHGMQDQIVPFKTVVDLAEALMRQGKDFDFAFAPGATHGWTGRPHHARYLLGKLLAHFERHLAVPE
ncbi:MAG: prolyl oligopeptidase family serine peptidase [Planctomycetota bacterium]